MGVAGALKPYSAAGDRGTLLELSLFTLKLTTIVCVVNNEKDYLARLELIRQQNYHDRKILHQKLIDHKNAYKVIAFSLLFLLLFIKNSKLFVAFLLNNVYS